MATEGWAVDELAPGVIKSWDWFFLYFLARKGKETKGRGSDSSSDTILPVCCLCKNKSSYSLIYLEKGPCNYDTGHIFSKFD